MGLTIDDAVALLDRSASDGLGEVALAGTGRSEVEQVARNLLDAGDGFLLGKRYLILDRDPLHTREFRAAMKRGGVDVLRLPRSSPNLNAYAERFVLSIRSECLDRIVPLGEAHLQRNPSTSGVAGGVAEVRVPWQAGPGRRRGGGRERRRLEGGGRGA
jgi:hypothetical protein